MSKNQISDNLHIQENIKEADVMALPNPVDIRKYYLEGKWTDVMLRCALNCKSITQEEYDSIRKAKADHDAAKPAEAAG